MHKVRQNIPADRLEDVAGALRKELEKEEIRAKIKPGANVVVGVGSRGVQNIALIVKTVVDFVKEAGGVVTIVSAMGSHGGGREDGQREMLAGYNITEETMGVPVITKVDSTLLGQTKTRGVDVWFDNVALAADLVIPINRVKFHTHFSGPAQSGLCKMLTIGFGNHVGCSTYHGSGFKWFGQTMLEAVDIIMEKANIGFGVAAVENAYDETYLIEAIPGENIQKREADLLKIAGENYPRIMIPEIDILVVKEIGKNISGTGVDCHVIGKSFNIDEFPLPVPDIDRMVVLGATEESHGNMIGIGNFDVCLREMFEQIDYEATYANGIAALSGDDAKIPIIAADYDEAMRIAVKLLRPGTDKKNLRIVTIKNTLQLTEIEVSDSLLPYVAEHPDLELI